MWAVKLAIGSLIVSLSHAAERSRSAGGFWPASNVSLYWGGAMVGRFIGAWLLRAISHPARYWLARAAMVILLLTVSANNRRQLFSGWSLLAIRTVQFPSCFPTIFSLASEGPGQAAPRKDPG